MTKLVGILNVTPDSFSDGGLYDEPEVALRRAAQLFGDGAALVDVGAESTRPGAKPLTTEAEWQRLLQILQRLIEQYPEQISVDTYHPETAAKALGLGDVIINDVTGMQDPAMVELVAKHHARCVISHLPAADPQAAHMGKLISSAQQVVDDLSAKAVELQKKGLPKKHIILDPGIGFGKTEELNRELLKFAAKVPGTPEIRGQSTGLFSNDRLFAKAFSRR